jgi:hypothetical protein
MNYTVAEKHGDRKIERLKENLDIPRRILGRTGVEDSILALGGYHLGLAKSKREDIRNG